MIFKVHIPDENVIESVGATIIIGLTFSTNKISGSPYCGSKKKRDCPPLFIRKKSGHTNKEMSPMTRSAPPIMKIILARNLLFFPFCTDTGQFSSTLYPLVRR